MYHLGQALLAAQDERQVSAIHHLLHIKHAAAMCASTKDGGRRRVDRQGINVEIDQVGVDSAPVPVAVGALQHAPCPGIEGGRRDRIDRQGVNVGTGQAGEPPTWTFTVVPPPSNSKSTYRWPASSTSSWVE